MLHERLLSAQSEFTQASQAWLKERVDIENLAANDKAHLLTSYSEKEQALIQESAEQLQSALNEIKLAKQLSEHWVVAHDASQMELSAIKSSMTWRLAALLAKLTRRNNFNKLNEVTIFKLNQASNFASTNNLMNSQNITNKYFEEVNMNSNTQPDTNQRITPMGSLIELLGYNDEAFIRAAYNTFLRRAPDAEGMSYYLNKLRSGSDKLEVLDQIVRSKEAKQHAVKLSGLNGAANQKKWLKIPFIGSMLRKRDVNKNLNIIENQLFRLNESIVNRFNQLEKTQQSLVQQVQTSSAANMIQQFVGDHAGSWKNAEKLLYCDEKTFLAILFNLGLQRGPEIHENKHFLDLLTAGANRLQIIESIFTCVESKSLYAQKQNANQPVVAAVALKATNNNNPEDLASVVILDTVTTEVVANENLEQVASLALPIDLTDGTSEQSLPFVTPPNITPEIVAYSGPVQIASVSAESINFFAHEKPLVSVIIPVYGKIEYTLMCLKSIQENLPEVDFEIILVDDKSPDNTAIELAKVRGIKLISNAENLGFIRSCNYGASQASGQYLCFLNNDTEVKTGWLDELVRTFYEFPNTGLVGSKFIYPDGSLQEAGGIIWQDGSAWNFGRNQDSALPIYNYAREVDYCSGASIMIPSSLFNGLGGFDEHYLPAYCEDSDLALKIRDRGYRVIYQPLSVVTHYEGITSGTDTSQGTKAYQIENSKKLFARWESHLKLHQLGGVDVDKAKDRKAKRRVLILDHCTPTPNQDAGSVTVFNLMLLLREMEFQVTFIPEDNFLYMPEYTTALQRVGVEVLYAPYYTSVEQHLAESGSRYDLAFIFRPSVIDRHLNTVRKFCTNAKVLYHTVDLHFLRMMREAELLKDPAKLKAANEMKKLELKAIRSADATIVHSPTELEILRQDLPKDKIYTFPLIMDVCRTDKPFQERSNIVFVGGYQHTPNIDAVQYFVNKVMPLLRRKLPKVRFYAVGSKAPQEILDLACDDVIITGFIDDLNPLLNDMRISVAPLRYGAGIKGKIGTAMVTGLPTVATTLAVEGMNLTDGENILVADGEKAFAAAIIKIYNDEALWNKVSKDGIAFAENAWGAGTAYNTLELILADLNLAPSKINSSLNSYAPFKINTLKTKLSLSNSPHITESLSVTESTSVTENKEYRAKIEQELAIYEKQEKVHDLPEIFHYWSNKFLFPIVKNAGFTSVNNFFSSTLYESWKKTNIVRPYFLSIGAGNCDLEIDLAKELLEFGCNDFIFECLELNPVMLERAFANAEKSGVQNHMKFTQTDFNTWIPTREYFGVIANQSLHHVTELEHLFGQVKKCMHKKGVFVISDIIGRNGHQRWPESLKLVHQFWEELPKPFKFNLILNRHEPVYENWDCSKEGFEGIRAQDILPLLLKDFKCDKFIGFGSVIDIFVDRAFGHHFNPNNVKDLEFIDRIHEADELGLQSGELTPTHMMAVFKKTSSLNPYISRDVTPEKSVRIE